MSSRILLDFTVFPVFNATADVDFGPGTTHQIRYTKAQYLAMLKQRVDALSLIIITDIDLTVTYNGNVYVKGAGPSDIGTGAGGNSAPGILGVIESAQWLLTSAVSAPEYPACPYADGMGDPREDAVVSFSASILAQFEIEAYHPHIAQTSWHTVTEVWLKSSFSFGAGSDTFSYLCSPSSSNGGGSNGPFPSNFVGIDYADDHLFGYTYDFAVALGDGTTHALFKDPGTANKYEITNLTTTN